MLHPMIAVYVIVVLALFSLFQGLSMMVGERPSEGPASLRRKTLAEGISPWLAEIFVIQRIRDFELIISSSGIRFSPSQVVMGMAVTTSAVMLAMDFAKFGLFSSVAGGFVVGSVVPILVIRRWRLRRMALLVRQLPDALDAMVRSLRVGHPVAAAIAMIGTEMPDPIGTEFKRVSDAMSYGRDLKDALEGLSARLSVPDVRYLVGVIRIQHSTGGNLADILSSLSHVIRQRMQLAMKVKALSAETRFSAKVMAALPFLLAGGILFLRPDFYKEVPGSAVLQDIMAGAGALIAIGILLMRRIVNVRA